MDITELNEFIKSELNGCSGYAFIDKVIHELNVIISNHPYFQADKFKTWFIEKNVAFRTSPIAFLKKCGFADIEKGLFDKDPNKSITINVLCKAMRQRGISVGNEIMIISVIENYIFRNELMTIEELKTWNHTAIDYLSTKENPSTADFVVLFEKSKTMRQLNLPLKELIEEGKKASEEWESDTDELDKIPHYAMESETK